MKATYNGETFAVIDTETHRDKTMHRLSCFERDFWKFEEELDEVES